MYDQMITANLIDICGRYIDQTGKRPTERQIRRWVRELYDLETHRLSQSVYNPTEAHGQDSLSRTSASD